MRVELIFSHYLGMLSEGLFQAGQLQEALAVAAEAFEKIVHQNGEHFYEAELYRLKGEMLLAQSAANQAEAEASFHKAIGVARGQSTKLFELRAVLSLSRLLQKQGKSNEARAMLADIYGWFTEGFETKDLQEARMLLGELSGSQECCL